MILDEASRKRRRLSIYLPLGTLISAQVLPGPDIAPPADDYRIVVLLIENLGTVATFGDSIPPLPKFSGV